jgi:hypothetical protein
MRRIEYFLTIIIYLLASIAYLLAETSSPFIIKLPVLILVFGTPVFLLVSVLYEVSDTGQ